MKKGWNEEGVNGLDVGALLSFLRNPIEVTKAVYERGFGAGRFALRIQMVQEPSFDSRVQYSSERDMFGLYKTLLDWRFTKLDRQTLDETIKYCADVFTRETLGLLKVDSPVIENFPEIPIDLRGDEHHSGTTRMGADDTDGVVDKI